MLFSYKIMFILKAVRKFNKISKGKHLGNQNLFYSVFVEKSQADGAGLVSDKFMVSEGISAVVNKI